MKVLQASGGLLTNAEVLAVLRDRGCDGQLPSARSLASEKVVYHELSQCSPDARPEKLRKLMAALQPFKLSRAEQLQVINLAPSSMVEVHLIMERCEERLTEDQVTELLSVVSQHITKPQPAPLS